MRKCLYCLFVCAFAFFVSSALLFAKSNNRSASKSGYVSVTPLSATTTITSISSANSATGAINLIPAGGQTPYTFFWSDGITTEDRTNLIAGTYTVTITDANGSSFKKTETFYEKKLTINTIVSIESNCGYDNGQMIVGSPNGFSPVTFTKNGGSPNTTGDFQSLVGGAYLITATDANGFKGSQYIGINDVEMDGLLFSKNDVTCNGGSDGKVEVKNVSGTPPIKFQLDNNGTYKSSGVFTGLAAGSHAITIKDGNGCVFVSPFTISEPAKLKNSNSVTAVSSAGATDGAVGILPSGGTAPYTYNWGNGILTQNRSGLTAGTYTVTVTDSKGCQKTEVVTVGTSYTVLPVSLLSFKAKADGSLAKLEWITSSEQNNDYFEVARSIDGIVFSLMETINGSGTTNQKRIYSTFDKQPLNGVNYYRLSQINKDGQVAILGVREVTFDLEDKSEVQIYPNPATNDVQIYFPSGAEHVQLTDISGKVLQEFFVNNSVITLNVDISKLVAGNYLIRISGKQGIVVKKLVKL